MTNIRLSVVLPTYNERVNVGIAVSRILESCGSADTEVIVVDDNSPDGTWQVAEEIAALHPQVSVLRRMHEKGLSSAVLTGFAASSGRYVAVMDSDLQHDAAVLPRFLRELEAGAEIVVGSRKAEGGAIAEWHWFRRFISGAATRLSQALLPLPVSDPMSGFFALRRELYLAHGASVNPRGFKILLEFLWRARGCRVAEVGYVFQSRIHGQSKLSSSVMFDLVEALVELRWGHIVSPRFLKYGMVGATGVAVSQGGLYLGKHLFGFDNSQALALGIEASIVSNFLLNNAWTFRKQALRKPGPFLRGLLSFHAICLAGAFMNHAVALFLVERRFANIYFANLMGIGLATVWNYFINANVTWKASNRVHGAQQ